MSALAWFRLALILGAVLAVGYASAYYVVSYLPHASYGWVKWLHLFALCLGWGIMSLTAVLVAASGLPDFKAPRGCVRIIYFGFGLAVVRRDLHERVMGELAAAGWRFWNVSKRYALSPSFPGWIARRLGGRS